MSEQKRLYRSTTDKMVCGVAAGLADYIGVDPVLVRLAFVLLTLAGNGLGVLVYIALCVVMPEAGGRPMVQTGPRTETTSEQQFEPLGTRNNE